MGAERRQPAVGPGPARRGAFWATAAALGLLALAVPLLLTARYGALGIPRSDDWSYLVTLFRLVDSGHLSFNHWVSMSLVGQLALAAPLAAVSDSSIAAVQVETAIVGLLGLVCVVLVGDRTLQGRWAGALLALTIAAGPLWGPLAVSFMTDVPAFACSMLAMLLAVVALARRPVSVGWLAASLLAGVAAFTIRQYAIVAVLAALVAGIWWFASVGDRPRALRTAAIGAVLLLAAAAFYAWWRTVPDVRSLSPSFPDGHAVRVTVVKGAGFIRLAGLLLLPVIVYAGPIGIARRAWTASRSLCIVAAALPAAWLLGTAWRVPSDLFVGNYVMRDGVLSDIVVIGRRPDVFAAPVWEVLVVLGTAAGIVLVVATVPAVVALVGRVRERDWRLRDPIDGYLALTVLGYAGTYAIAMATGLQVYDRYVLPVLPAIGLVLLRATARASSPSLAREAAPAPAPAPVPRRAVATVLAWLALAAVGLAYSADSASFDGARWKAAKAATALGWSPRNVNGGFEWLNYHRRDKLEPATGADARDVRRPTICVTVHVNPRIDPERVVAVVESTAPTRGAARLVAFRTAQPCPSPRPANP